MSWTAVEVGDRWVICDAQGHEKISVCPCCERNMLTREAAERVIREIDRAVARQRKN